MWSTNPLAIYAGQTPPISIQSKVLPKSSTSSKPRPSTTSSSRKPSQSYGSEISPNMSIPDFFEPAMDRPPSPAKLRQLSKQMKRASHLRRQSGHRVGASTSSSLTSLNSDFSGLEQAFDNFSLARQSSIRSTDSNAPEGVYGFGKNMFHRRRKSKRESSANSSSASSLNSSDSPADNTLVAGPKESFMPSLFSRRKGSRDDISRRKVQISGPYNFQHVTHTDRESVPAVQQLVNQQGPDLLTMRATGPSPVIPPSTINGPETRDFSTHSEANTRPAFVQRHAATVSGPQRLMRRIRSQDQLREHQSVSSPPRPPRSPTHQIQFHSFSPIPPPRVSSRQGLYHDGIEHFTFAAQERPKTSGGFWRPSPYSPTTSLEHLPPTFARPSTPTKHDDFNIDGSMKSPVQPPSNDLAWPLASPAISYETPLPDVPEEEEQSSIVRRSRLSLASNASLRPSQSVPMLRSLAKVQRPISGASETLGYFDITAAQQVVVERLEESHASYFGVIRESWEDDIDYCYEHEAEATCDYQWDRCSLDTARDGDTLPVDIAFAANELQVPIGTAESSPGMLPVSRFDVPSLIPGSRNSTATTHEAITPTSNPLAGSNFSLPLVDKRLLRASHASSFKESHGFTLSPSLLIPGDFHHQLLLAEGGRHEYPEDDELMAHHQASYDEVVNPISWLQQRSSTSTTGTNSTASRSDSTGDRHISGISAWSFQTRHTTSSTSLNKMAGSLNEEAEPVPTVHLTETVQNDASQDTVPELIPFPSSPIRKHSYHKAHASESIMYDDISPSMKFVEAVKRRSRAKTTSMSSQAPPVGQYALFPRSYIKPNGDRI